MKTLSFRSKALSLKLFCAALLFIVMLGIERVGILPVFLLFCFFGLIWSIKDIEIHVALMLMSAGWFYNYHFQTPHNFHWYLLSYYMIFLPIKYRINIARCLRLSRQELFLMLYLTWVAVTVVYAGDPIKAIQRAVGFWAVYIVAKMVKEYARFNGFNLTKFSKWLFVGLGSHAVYVLIFYEIMGSPRLGFGLIHPNIFGLQLFLTFCFGSVVVITSSSKPLNLKAVGSTFVYGSILIVTFLALLMTHSREAMLGTLISQVVIWAFVLHKFNSLRFSLGTVTILVITIVGLGYYLVPYLETAYPKSYIWYLSRGSFRDFLFVRTGFRLEAWYGGLMSADLILGSGYASAPSVYYRGLTIDVGGAHNAYIQILRETGVIGFFLYFMFLVEVLRNISKAAHRPGYDSKKKIYMIGILGYMVGLMVSSMFENAIVGVNTVYGAAFIFFAEMLDAPEGLGTSRAQVDSREEKNEYK